MRGAFVLVLAALGLGATCRVHPPDEIGTGDERYDESTRADKATPDAGPACRSDTAGNVVLLDARTGSPLTCVHASVSRVTDGCQSGDCSPIPLYDGLTNGSGQVRIQIDPARARLAALAEGYALSYRAPAAVAAGQLAEIEMQPEEGFLLKFLDKDGNYLTNLQVTFKQGNEAIAALRTNELANVFFNSRNPFGGQAFTVEAEGYAPVTIAGAADLGSDGHSVTLKK